MMSIAIQVSQLSKTFGRRVVLEEVDLAVAEGESVVFTGANGAGKTTLLRCVASIIRPSSGEVRWFGQPVVGNTAARRLVGMVAHESRSYPHLTLRENLIFAARMCDVPRPQRRVDLLLDNVGLGLHAQRTPAVLSQGMRQRLAVARALVHDPPILLLDEPFAGLDAEGTRWLLGLLSDIRGQGRTLCLVLHDEEKKRLLADRVLELRQGRIRQQAAALARAA
jgi:ABC-type multidrug transport system ATPase subunit